MCLVNINGRCVWYVMCNDVLTEKDTNDERYDEIDMIWSVGESVHDQIRNSRSAAATPWAISEAKDTSIGTRHSSKPHLLTFNVVISIFYAICVDMKKTASIVSSIRVLAGFLHLRK